MTDQEINEAVARKLGWTDLFLSQNIGVMDIAGKRNPTDTLNSTVPEYCKRIAAAWDVVDWLELNKLWWNLSYDPVVKRFLFRYGPFALQGENQQASADIAPMAICLAFLKTK